MTIKKIMIISSGGDAPGMNAAIRAAVRTAINAGLEVYASENGYSGLVKQKLISLTDRSVGNIIQRGGTILKTARVPSFYEKATRDRCRNFLLEQKIDAIVVLGGDGSFRGVTLLQEEGGPPAIGIPCTIDNDIVGTEYCIGFDTACNTALEAIDKIRDTALSLDRNFLIEVMGRSSGFLAVEVGIAGGAEIILTPEFPLNVNELCEKVTQQHGKKLASIIVAAEAGEPGHSLKLAETIKEKTGIEYKVCILGHIQRGGMPSAKDRVIGSLMGAKAIALLIEGETGKMLAVQNGKITATHFPDPKNPTRFFNDPKLIHMNEVICEIA